MRNMKLRSCWCVEEPEKDYDLPPLTVKKICRLKLNWFYIVVTSLLVAFCSSSPNPTLRAYLTNPTVLQLAQFNDTSDYEPGLGKSDRFFIWSNLSLNIGSIFGALLGAILASFIPYCYSILLSLLIHLTGSLLYATAVNGPLLLLARTFAGLFMGLQTTLAFAYFGQSSEYYVQLHKEAGVSEKDVKDKHRVKNVLFTLFTVMTYLGYFFGEVPSAVFARFTMDHYRAIGWCNLVLGAVTIVMLPLIFRGEMSCQSVQKLKQTFTWKGPVTRSSFYVPIIVAFLIACSAVINTRMAVHSELFPAILRDSFGVVGKVKENISLTLLVPPLLGGALILCLQAKHVRNIMISVFGIILSIIGLILLIDWQAIPHDSCTFHSLYHHPEIVLNYTEPSTLLDNVNKHTHLNCWNDTQDDDIIDSDETLAPGVDLLVSVDPVCIALNEREVDCGFVLDPDEDFCSSSTLPHHLGFSITNDDICLLNDTDSIFNLKPVVGVSCSVKDNVSCISACWEEDTSISHAQGVGSTSNRNWKSIKSLFMLTIGESWRAVLRTVYDYAQSVCESDQQHHCHWVPYSSITSEVCYDCPPICRSRRHTLSLAQFCIGAVWFMMTAPIAQVALPLVISDCVKSKYQGVTMGLTVMGIAVFRCITPLWLQVAYEAAQKRTFLPLLIMIATFLPFLFGLLLLVLFPVLPHLQSLAESDEDEVSEKTAKPEVDSEHDSDSDDDSNNQQTLEKTSLMKAES